MHIHAYEQKKEELEKVVAKLEKNSHDYKKKKSAGAAEVRPYVSPKTPSSVSGEMNDLSRHAYVST